MIVVGDEVVRWVTERSEGDFIPGFHAGIGIAKNGALVGGCVFEGYNGASINIHVASDGSGHWLNREFLFAVFDYPFRQLGVKRVTGIVPSCNEQARRFDEKVGFELETTLKDAHPNGDLLIYKMTRDKCRWLAWKGKK